MTPSAREVTGSSCSSAFGSDRQRRHVTSVSFAENDVPRRSGNIQTVAETTTSMESVYHPIAAVKTMTDCHTILGVVLQIHHQSDHLLRGALAEISVPHAGK